MNLIFSGIAIFISPITMPNRSMKAIGIRGASRLPLGERNPKE